MKKLLTVLAICTVCAVSSGCGSSSDTSSERPAETTAAVSSVTQATEAVTTHVHDTHTGKCSGCGEYVLDGLYIPSYKDFSSCLGVDMIPSWIVKEEYEDGTGGFYLICHADRTDLLDDCESFSGKIVLYYGGDRDYHILERYEIQYIPKDTASLNAVESAVIEQVSKMYGKSKGTWKKSGDPYWDIEGGGIQLVVGQGANFISILLDMDLDNNSTDTGTSDTTVPEQTIKKFGYDSIKPNLNYGMSLDEVENALGKKHDGYAENVPQTSGVTNTAYFCLDSVDFLGVNCPCVMGCNFSLDDKLTNVFYAIGRKGNMGEELVDGVSYDELFETVKGKLASIYGEGQVVSDAPDSYICSWDGTSDDFVLLTRWSEDMISVSCTEMSDNALFKPQTDYKYDFTY